HLMDSNYWTQSSRRAGRRSLIRGALLTGAGLSAAALVGCGSDDGEPEEAAAGGGGAAATSTGSGGGAAAAGEPVRGGTLMHGEVADLTQHDMNTALGGAVWHYISERAIE